MMVIIMPMLAGLPMDLAFSKDKLAKNTVHRLLKFFSKQNTITAGYTLKGKPVNNYQSASFSAPIYIAVNENRNQGYDNLFDSQQYIFAADCKIKLNTLEK